MTKKMTGVNSQRTIPNLTVQDQQFETNRDKAQLFARTFAKVSSDENHSHEFRKIKDVRGDALMGGFLTLIIVVIVVFKLNLKVKIN